MKNFLETILATKQQEVEAARRRIPLQEIERRLSETKLPHRSLRASLAQADNAIIAEFKRKSPSKGWIHPEARPEEVIPLYAQSGAAGISVLTDTDYFGGSLAYLEQVRPLVDTPLLRKDFIIDTYQLYEARLAGADAVLLIAAALGSRKARRLAEEAHSLGLEVLLEIHDEAELDAYGPEVDLLGVNNRNLKTFVTDPRFSFSLVDRLPREALWVSESGLHDPALCGQLRQAGYGAFLIGESLMKTKNPGAALSAFIQAMQAHDC